MTRALLAAIGIAAMAAAGFSLATSLPAGFPDGTITPWDQATGVWVTIGTYALLIFGIFTLVASVMNRPGRAAIGAVLIVLLAPSLWLVDACPSMPWCRDAVQQLTGIMVDDGQGG